MTINIDYRGWLRRFEVAREHMAAISWRTAASCDKMAECVAES